MGLDMYLKKRTYTFNGKLKDIDFKSFKNISYIVEDAGYWRGSWHIHNWIVENIQDGVDNCAEYLFDQDDMATLLDLVNRVLSDHKLAPELLSTGDYENADPYDKHYFETLQETKMILENAISEVNEFYYYSSW